MSALSTVSDLLLCGRSHCVLAPSIPARSRPVRSLPACTFPALSLTKRSYQQLASGSLEPFVIEEQGM